mgnify:CR=1 FL=1
MIIYEQLKIIPADHWLCVEIIMDGTTYYFYPPKEELPKEWMYYRVISTYALGKKQIVIIVEDIEND